MNLSILILWLKPCSPGFLIFTSHSLYIMSDSRYSALDIEESKRSFETTSSDVFLQSPRKPLLTIGVLPSQDSRGKDNKADQAAVVQQ